MQLSVEGGVGGRRRWPPPTASPNGAGNPTKTCLPHAALHFPLRHPAVVAGLSDAAQSRAAADWSAQPVEAVRAASDEVA